MSRPVEDAIEAYLKAEHGLTETVVSFSFGETWDYGYGGETSSRTEFGITVMGTRPDGESYYETYADSAAVTFLDKIMSWEVPS